MKEAVAYCRAACAKESDLSAEVQMQEQWYGAMRTRAGSLFLIHFKSILEGRFLRRPEINYTKLCANELGPNDSMPSLSNLFGMKAKAGTA
jgi:hypothetical protein